MTFGGILTKLCVFVLCVLSFLHFSPDILKVRRAVLLWSLVTSCVSRCDIYKLLSVHPFLQVLLLN